MTTSIFYVYSHKDEKCLQRLQRHMSELNRRELVTSWHDRCIEAGSEWRTEIGIHLDAADIILLLISPDFMSSDYCYGIEMKRALERHAAREARVIPVILRHTDWESSPFASLQSLPTDGKPLSVWRPSDKGYLDVVTGIRRVLEARRAQGALATLPVQQPLASTVAPTIHAERPSCSPLAAPSLPQSGQSERCPETVPHEHGQTGQLPLQDSETLDDTEESLTPTELLVLERLTTVNLFGDFLQDLQDQASRNPGVLGLSDELPSWETADTAVQSLGVWARVGLAVRCAERVSSILSYWPLRKHCANNAIRAARGCAIAGTDFHSMEYGQTMDRIEELTAIGRAAFDAGVDAAKQKDGSAPKSAADSAGQAAFAARDAFRGATTQCAHFAVQLAIEACEAVSGVVKPLGNTEGAYGRLFTLTTRLPAAATRADLEWLRTHVSHDSPVPIDFFRRQIWSMQYPLDPPGRKDGPSWKLW